MSPLRVTLIPCTSGKCKCLADLIKFSSYLSSKNWEPPCGTDVITARKQSLSRREVRVETRAGHTPRGCGLRVLGDHGGTFLPFCWAQKQGPRPRVRQPRTAHCSAACPRQGFLKPVCCYLADDLNILMGFSASRYLKTWRTDLQPAPLTACRTAQMASVWFREAAA